MKMFYIQSRRGAVSLLEVEIEKLTALEDPSIMYLLKGDEYKAKVLKPISLYEDKKGTLVPPIWCWHAFFATEQEARTRAEQDIKHDMERDARKSGTEFDACECIKRWSEIQVVYL